MSVRTLVKSIQDIMRQDSGVDGDAQRISQLCWMFFLKIIDDQDQELELLKEDYKSPIPEKFQWRSWAADPEGITGDELLEFINNELFPTLKELPVSVPRARTVRDVFEDAYNYMKSGQLVRQVVNKINGIDFNNLTERQHFGDIYEQILNDLQSAGNAGEYYTPRAVTSFMVQMTDPKPGETILDPACGTGGFLTCAMRYMRERYVKRPEDEAALQASLRAVEKKPLPHMLAVTNMLLHGVEDPSFLRHDNTLARPYISWEQKDRVDIVLTNPPFGGREEDGIESNFPQHFRTRETADLFLALIIRVLKPGGRAAVVLPDGSLFGEGVKTRLKEHLMEECNLHTIVRLPNSVFRPYASIGTNLLFFEKGEPTQDIWFWEHLVPEGQKAYSMTRPIRLEHLDDCAAWWGGPRREGREGERARLEGQRGGGEGPRIQPRRQEPSHGGRGSRRPRDAAGGLGRSRGRGGGAPRPVEGDPVRGAGAMNTDRLLALYEKVAEAPDAIPRLRRFVLDLAVRGKLVPRDQTDEPASELLKRIAAEKARLVKVGQIKVRKLKSRERNEPLVFTLPKGWALTELGDISVKITDGAHKTPTYVKKGVPFVSVKDFSGGKLDLSNTRFIPESEHELLYQRCDPRRGDILLGRIGTLGKAVLVDTDVEFSLFVSVGLIRFDHRNLLPEFFLLLLNSPFVEEEFNRIKIGGGTHTNKLNLGDLHTVALPLPPLAEQRRIVAKVEELMALLDRLEAARGQREATRDRLTAASLARLTAPDADPANFPANACFTLTTLPALTTRPDQIKPLRQTILNLAVRGRLVAQDPTDEPASELLKRDRGGP
jgi:type I restriction enzyme M protein